MKIGPPSNLKPADFLERPDDFISIKEAAALLKKSESTIRRYVALELLTHVTVGRTTWIDRRGLVSVIE